MNSSKPIVAFNAATHAAAAAANASKPGLKTSEMWVGIGAAALAAVAGVFIPGLGAAAVPVALGLVSAGYAISRGNVKGAALAAATAAKAIPGPVGQIATDTEAIVEAAGGAK